MRHIRNILPALILSSSVLASSASDQFINGGFESGTTGWTIEHGIVDGTGPDQVNWGPTSNIVNPLVIDVNTPLMPLQILAVDPCEGMYSLRINDLVGGMHATRVWQDITLTSALAAGEGKVRLCWGAMLVEPPNPHTPVEEPWFKAEILANTSVINEASAVSSDALNPGNGWTHTGNSIYYKQGQFDLDIGAQALGTVIRVQLSVRDCALGNHGGAAFLDSVELVISKSDSFCEPGMLNSAGVSAVLTGLSGSGVGSDWHVDVTDGVPGQLIYLLVGNEATSGIAISDGLFCLGGTSTAQFFRYNVTSTDMNSIGFFDATGAMLNAVGTSTTGFGFDVPSTIPSTVPLTIMVGDTWHFQGWYRDTPSGFGTSNFTNGLSITF